MRAATAACERGGTPPPGGGGPGGPVDEGSPARVAFPDIIERGSSLAAVLVAVSSLRAVSPPMRSSFMTRQFAGQRRGWRPPRIEHVSCANCNRTVPQEHFAAIRAED